MYIGNLKINNIASLAPMAGVTDRAFREICEMFGVAYFTSEMISTKGIVYGSKKTFELCENTASKTPFAIQLFGNNPDDFKNAIKLLGDKIPQIIDINMGCPATKIVKENSGSALMKNPDLCGDIVFAAKSISPVPVTVKIRSGWNEESINAVEVAKICEQAGASAITVHGRTRSQGYSGKCNLEIIKNVKENVSIPVIGNGDITCAEDALHMMNYTKCDMVAVGRGSMGNPWIFSEINSAVEKIEYEKPTLEEKVKVMKLHLEKLCKYKGEQKGIKEARKHISCYVKDIFGATKIRQKIFTSNSHDEMTNLLDGLDVQ